MQFSVWGLCFAIQSLSRQPLSVCHFLFSTWFFASSVLGFMNLVPLQLFNPLLLPLTNPDASLQQSSLMVFLKCQHTGLALKGVRLNLAVVQCVLEAPKKTAKKKITPKCSPPFF